MNTTEHEIQRCTFCGAVNDTQSGDCSRCIEGDGERTSYDIRAEHIYAKPATTLPAEVDALLRALAAERSGGWDEADVMDSCDLSDALDAHAATARDLLARFALPPLIGRDGAPIYPATCANCGAGYDADEDAMMLQPAPGALLPCEDWTERVATGETVPAGECSTCGCAVYAWQTGGGM